MKQVEYILQRVLKAALVVLGVVVLNFVLIRAAPGDPAMVMAGEAGAADSQFLQQIRAEFGLDQPLPVQLWRYVVGVATLDLGYSYRQKEPVLTLLLDRVPATLLLTGTAFVLSLALGVLLGALAASRAGSWFDSALTVLALGFYATPIFWIGLMLVLLFSVNLGWLPAFGMESLGAGLSGWARMADIARHLTLPMLTLALFYAAIYARMTRASVLEVRDLDFVKTARAKGLSASRVMRAHVLRNAILPVITLAGVQAGQLIGGSILVETVFAWPGIGRLAFDALMQRDYQLLLGVFLLTSTLVVVLNLVTDIVYGWVDPRIQVGS